jgi:HAD superfamily hydrolase (TIGR01549 family)
MKLSSYDVIILDCDGVVFDSNLLKIEAFQKTLNSYELSIVDAFIEYFKNNFGTSRYFLIKVFIEKFLKQNFEEELYQSLLKEYSKNCVLLYQESKLTNQFIEFVQHNQNKKLYIASGSDESELNKVFHNRNIHHFFKKIYGSPIRKNNLIKKILIENPNSKILMIGDAQSDLLASLENNIEFISMMRYSLVKNTMNKLSRKYNFMTINDLGELINE